MLEQTHSTVLEVLEYLGTLARNQANPEDACEGLEGLRSRHPQSGVELVWEDQAFDRSLHYDALIRTPQALTVSISVCPDRALPWPLRGVQRSTDADLLRVNEVKLRVAEAVIRLDVLWENHAVMRRLVDTCLFDDALRTQTIHIDPHDIQAALDAIRRRRGLHRAADMRAWMRSTGATKQTLERMAIEVARASKLRDVVVGERAQLSLRENTRDFDLLSFAELRMPSEESARAAADSINSGRGNFHDVAERVFLEAPDEEKGARFRRCRRYRLEAPLRDAFAAAEAGAVVGPVMLSRGTIIAKLLAVGSSGNDPQALEAAKTRVFDEWLAEARRNARIEWFWGNRQQTSRDLNEPSPELNY